jgi:hypothetical protein
MGGAGAHHDRHRRDRHGQRLGVGELMRKIAATVLLCFFGATLAAQTSIFVWPGTNSFPGTANITTLNTTTLCLDVTNFDTCLSRDSAAVLALKNGTTAQEFRVYGTTTGSKYTSITNDGASAVIDGVGTSLLLRSPLGTVSLTAGSGNIQIVTGNSLIWQTDNATDIGGTAANRPRTGNFGTSVIAPTVSAANYRGSGTGTSVANVGANSCGTTTATIAGNQVSGVITVGATSGTQCRVTFTTAAPVARDCTVTDSTTTIATRATVVDVSNTDFLGAFVAGDKVTFVCMTR